jgi:hypothetical protein
MGEFEFGFQMISVHFSKGISPPVQGSAVIINARVGSLKRHAYVTTGKTDRRLSFDKSSPALPDLKNPAPGDRMRGALA